MRVRTNPVSIRDQGFSMFMINAGEIDLQPDFKRKPAVVSRAQRNIRRNARVRIELKLSLVRDKLQRAAKTGRVAEAEEMFRSCTFLARPAEFLLIARIGCRRFRRRSCRGRRVRRRWLQ